MKIIRTASLVLAIGFTGAAYAIPPEVLGEPVDNISARDGISDWSPVDNRRVLVNLNEQDTYLLTLKHQCHGLSWAQNVTVTMSNNTIWAGFDAIKADGLKCPIDRISKMSAADLLELDR